LNTNLHHVDPFNSSTITLKRWDSNFTIDCLDSHSPTSNFTRALIMSKHSFSLLENLDIVNCGSKTFSGDEAREDFYYGGAVLIEGANITGGDKFEFRGVGFYDNGADRGGAISVGDHAHSPSITIIDSTFIGNIATLSGGALHFPFQRFGARVQPLNIHNCTFLSNSVDSEVGHGGAVSIYGGNIDAANHLSVIPRLNLTASYFGGNSALLGGALFATGLEPSSFTLNPIDADTFSLLRDVVEDTTFVNNEAYQMGGAASHQHVYGGTFYKNSIINNNVALGLKLCPQGDETCAGTGGGIAAVYTTLDITGTRVTQNQAKTSTEFSPRGAGIYAFYDTHGTVDPMSITPDALYMSYSRVSNNTCTSNDGAAEGGGIWLNGGGQVMHSTIEGNSAMSQTVHSLEYNAGGGIYVQRSGMLAEDGEDGFIVVRNVTFNENQVFPGGYGGALFAKGSTVIDIDLTTFSSNSVTSSQRIKAAGGAVAFTSGVQGTITLSVFTQNSAKPWRGHSYIVEGDSSYMPEPDGLSGEGGAIFAEASTLYVADTTFQYNKCESGYDSGASGGAISIVANNGFKESEFDQVHFLDNAAISSEETTVDKASGMGGAVHVMSASPIFYKCEFKNNIAKSGGSKNSIGGAVALRYAYNSSPMSTRYLTKFENVGIGVFSKGPKFVCCDFTNNEAAGDQEDFQSSGISIMQSGRGGAIAAVASVMWVANSTFVNNRATARDNSLVPSLGGAIYLDYDSKGKFIGSQFVKNQASNGAGSEICAIAVVRNDDSEAVEDVDISLVQNEANSSLVFHNTTFEPLLLTRDRRLIVTPAVLIFGGTVKFIDGKFGVGMKIVIAGPGSLDLFGSYLENVALADANLLIEGPLDQAKLDVLAWNAELSFEPKKLCSTCSISPAHLNGLKMVNSTISSSAGIIVEGDAWVFGGKLCGCDADPVHNEVPQGTVPTFEVRQGMLFGAPSSDFFDETFSSSYPISSELWDRLQNISNHKAWPIHVDALVLDIKGVLIVSVQYIYLNSTAAIMINEDGKLYVGAQVNVISNGKENHVSIYNYGTVEHSCVTNFLRLIGNFHQNSRGYMALKLPATKDWDAPIWQFEGSSNINGTLNISFVDGETINIGDAWPIATFVPSSSGSKNYFNLFTASPYGVSLVTSTMDGIAVDGDGGGEGVESSGKSDTLEVQVKYMKCETLYQYADEDESPCYTCLNARDGCNYCSGACLENNEVSSLPYGSCQTESCCTNECSGRGTCLDTGGLEEPKCECDWFFDGEETGCTGISTSGTLLLTCGVSLMLLVIITMAYYQFHNRRKREVVENALEELRYGLLTDHNKDEKSDARNKDSQVTDGYVKSLQQQLFLKDVAVPFAEVSLDEVIGEGTYGVVYKGIWRGGAVAIKMIRPNVLMGMGTDEIEQFKEEAYLMSRLRHPNIVLIMGISMRNLEALNASSARQFSTDSRINSRDSEEQRPSTVESLYIISEYMEQGSLADIMVMVREEEEALAEARGVSSTSSSSDSRLGWGYEMILACALQAARGMTYLHSYSPPICHRDLKSSNLVVDDHWVVKVTDFGVSRMLPSGEGHLNKSMYGSGKGALAAAAAKNFTPPQNSPTFDTLGRESMMGAWMTSNIGTTAWAAPEMLTAAADASYSLKVDVYSFGIVLWELCEREVPFKEFTSKFDMMDAIRKGQRPKLTNAPPFLQNLYARCVETEPSKRPKFAVIVKMLKNELSQLREKEGTGKSMRSDSFAWLSRGNSIDWLANNNNSKDSRAVSNNSSISGNRFESIDGAGGNGYMKSNAQPIHTGNGNRKHTHSIISNVLASPVLSPMFAKKRVAEEEEELDNFLTDDADTKRHSFS